MVTTARRRTTAAAVAIVVALVTAGQPAHSSAVSPAAESSPPSTAPSVDVEVYRACLANKPPPELRLPNPASALLAGYSNAAKLDSAAVLGFPESALAKSTNENEGLWAAYATVVDDENYVCNLAELQLDYQGRRELPPVRATFLTFGFMPVTATLHLTQVGDDPLSAVVYLDNGRVGTNSKGDGSAHAVATSAMSLRLSDVEVNGERLDVGDDCRTAGPLTSPDSPIDPSRLVLTGGNLSGEPEPRYGAIIYGGALAGRATIPPFTGCDAGGEDLDPLLTATVSGPGNDVKIVQGPLCAPGFAGILCVDNVLNEPRNRPLWTVTDGGPFTGAGTLTIAVGSGFGLTTITCADSAVSGVFADATGPPRRSLAAMEWTVGECAGRDRRGQTSTWTVSQDESLRIDGATYDPTSGVTSARLSGVSMRLVGTGVPGATGSCEIDLRGMGSATYANPPSGTLSVLAATRSFGSGISAVSTTCPGPLGPTGWFPSLSATYPLSPGTTTITSP